MPALTFFTAHLNYQVVEADTAADVDTDPQVQGVNAGVTLTPYVVQPPPTSDDVGVDELPASSLSPTAALVVLAPVDARLDNGLLMLRVDPDTVVHHYPSLASFPATGSSAWLAYAADTGKTYKWTGSAYVEIEGYAPVRLTAQTAVLGLPPGAILGYRIEFDHATYAGAARPLPGFAFKAATADVVLDLSTAERMPDSV
jgi:hypothetical protein